MAFLGVSIWYKAKLTHLFSFVFARILRTFGRKNKSVKQLCMSKHFEKLSNYLTWHPDVLAYTGLTILATCVCSSVILLLTL